MNALSELYNSLPPVEFSNEKLKSCQSSNVLNRLSEIIVKHELENTIGIRLLHNHNTIEAHEIMLEHEERNKSGQMCLVTSANKITDLTDYNENSWILYNGSFHAVEFSKDSEVTSEKNILSQKKDFFKEFGETLEYLDVSDILGPCIIKREFYNKYKPNTSFILAETSDIRRRANILKYENEDKFDKKKLIDTTWKAYKNEVESNKVFAGCTAACISISVCTPDGAGGHTRSTRHNKGTHIHSDD